MLLLLLLSHKALILSLLQHHCATVLLLLLKSSCFHSAPFFSGFNTLKTVAVTLGIAAVATPEALVVAAVHLPHLQ